MDAQTFIKNLKELSLRYEAWWFPPFEKFYKEYSKRHPDFDYENYFEAYKEFEINLRSKSDLIDEIYNFIDQNYDVYLNATPQEYEEIRKVVTDCYRIDEKGEPFRFLEDLFFRYTKEKALPKLKETGNKIWLTRGLIALSIENSGIDYRDSISALSELRRIAEKKGIDSQPEFERIAQISSNEKPRGGSTPMNQLMAKKL